jgi:hypothetical protein
MKMMQGKSKSPPRSSSAEYRAWSGMKDRCLNPNSTKYKWYGARGITVCQEWRDSFDTFFAHVGPRPSKDHSLGRIDNEGNYEPGNVEWQTEHQQQRNKRDTRLYEFNGQKKCFMDWAIEFGVSETTIRRRVARGFPIDQYEAPAMRAMDEQIKKLTKELDEARAEIATLRAVEARKVWP